MSTRKPRQGRTRSSLSVEDAARADTFLIDIAAALLPPGTLARAADSETRFGRHGSLAVRADGRFFDHEAGTGGRGAVSLVRHLLKPDCELSEAVAWVKQWMSAHPGTGSMTIETGDDTAAREKLNAEYAQRALAEMVPIAGTVAETYLVRERGLSAPWPDCLGYWPDARPNEGEGALAVPLTDRSGKLVGVHLIYLDKRGRKTTLPPAKRTFRLSSQAAAGAVYRVAGESPNPVSDPPADPADPEHLHRTTVICEGVEDALSVHLACPFSTVIGMPGVGQLKRLVGQLAGDVVVVRDGDHPDSGADKALVAGIDALLLAGGLSLRVTDTPLGKDANDILREQGPAALRQLIIEAKPAQLSRAGDIRRLARMPALDVTLDERKATAKRWDIQLRDLNKAIAAERDRADTEAAPETEELALSQWDEKPWDEPVTDIGAVLDAALAEISRFVVTPQSNLATLAVWSLHSHLVHRDDLLIPISPRLAIQAAERACGKTTALDVTRCMVRRPKPVVSTTAASFFRVITRDKPTLLIDEADKAFRRGYGIDLLQLINGGHSRAFTTVDRVEEIDGERQVVSYDVWGAVAMAGIGRLAEATTQSRCVVIQMKRAKQDEPHEHMKHGRSLVLEETRQKFARWSADLKVLPDILMPRELTNRVGDNWEILLQLASLAGPRWRGLILEAALSDAGSESATEGVATPLLHDIRVVFAAKARLRTEELCSGLLTLPDPLAEWGRINLGGPVSACYLRTKLQNLIDPPRAQQWREGPKTRRGYLVTQFADSFERYLTPEEQDESQPTGETHNVSGGSKNGVDENYIFPTPIPSDTSDTADTARKPSDLSINNQIVDNSKTVPDGESASGTKPGSSGTAPVGLVPDVPGDTWVEKSTPATRLGNGLDEAPEPNSQLRPTEEALW